MATVDDPLIDHVIELEKELHKPEVRQNAKQLTELLAKDFLEYGASGQVYTLTDIIDALTSETPQTVFSAHFSGQHLAPDIIHLTYQTSQTEMFLQGARRSSIWQKHNKQWQMIFHQGTPFKQ